MKQQKKEDQLKIEMKSDILYFEAAQLLSSSVFFCLFDEDVNALSAIWTILCIHIISVRCDDYKVCNALNKKIKHQKHVIKLSKLFLLFVDGDKLYSPQKCMHIEPWSLLERAREAPSFIINVYALRTVHISNRPRNQWSGEKLLSIVLHFTIWFTLPHRNLALNFGWLSKSVKFKTKQQKLDFSFIKKARGREQPRVDLSWFHHACLSHKKPVKSFHIFPDRVHVRWHVSMEMAWNGFRVWLCKI